MRCSTDLDVHRRHAVPDEPLEGDVAIAQVAVVWKRKRGPRAALNEDHAIGPIDGQIPEGDRVDGAEHERVDADAERERDNRQRRKAGTAPEASCGVTKIAAEI